MVLKNIFPFTESRNRNNTIGNKSLKSSLTPGHTNHEKLSPHRTLSHGRKRPRLGHQKQGLPGVVREVFGSGDLIDNLRKHNPNSEHRRKKSRQLAVGKTKNKKQRTKNKEQRTKNKEQRTLNDER
jgi:hypothetical protein